MPRRNKKYIEAVKKYDRALTYTIEEAIDLVKEMAFAKFDESFDVDIKLNLKKGQSVRDTLILPHQFKADKKIVVFAKGEKVDEAKEAGAAHVGDADLIEKIRGGWLDFDVAVATPDMMKDVGKLGPILGRRGLMPNPTTQTVTFNIKEALAELKKGRIEFRVDKTGVVHLSIGKLSMSKDMVKENAQSFIDGVIRKRPSDQKGDYVKSITLSSTMSPGVKINKELN